MSAENQRRLERCRRGLALAAGVGGVAVVALALVAPHALPAALQCALFACLAPALGSLLFALIHRLTGGEWGESLQPFLVAGARLAPWIWLGALPLALWSGDRATPAWPAYDSRPMLLGRAAFFAVILFGAARALPGRGRIPAAWTAPAAFILLVFTLHLLAEDWLAALEPHWHSTAFPLIWITGAAVAGLAFAVLAAFVVDWPPRRKRSSAEPMGIDWGNLLLAATLFWCYVAFAQFLIIWAGNLPRETVWFQHRTRGAWALVPWLLAVLHFGVPFAALLSRSFKQSAGLLATVAAMLLAAQILYAAWMILPAYSFEGLSATLLPGVTLGSALAFCAHCYLRLAQRYLHAP
jgi:hypothetical protein